MPDRSPLIVTGGLAVSSPLNFNSSSSEMVNTLSPDIVGSSQVTVMLFVSAVTTKSAITPL